MTAPLVLVHGFTQTSASFDPLIATLADHEIAAEAAELPGHDIGFGPDRLVIGDLWAGADDLVARTSSSEPRVWVGYSMGARLVLHLALAHPDAVAGLVLISGTAGIDDAEERAQRRAHDEDLAARIESIGVEAFLAEWLALPLFASLPSDADRITRRATNTAAGLASSLRQWGTGTMDPPLWDRLAEIDAPTLVIAGSSDKKFTALGRRLAASIGTNAAFAPIQNTGHAVLVERPGRTAEVIADWFGATAH